MWQQETAHAQGHMLKVAGWTVCIAQAETRGQEPILGLQCKWQGPKCSSHHQLFPRVYASINLELGVELGLYLRPCNMGCGHPKQCFNSYAKWCLLTIFTIIFCYSFFVLPAHILVSWLCSISVLLQPFSFCFPRTRKTRAVCILNFFTSIHLQKRKCSLVSVIRI